ncbi:hypothetical protein ACGFYP_34010 [Streptomyces sp. NPDC048370]|uniref:hypothetical protein n=1 Tax=Streptomyces sp. NPDC048370 TaxID=3365540 RepID=UPI00371D99DA
MIYPLGHDAIQLLGGGYQVSLPEFDALADAYVRICGPHAEWARASRAHSARCRTELNQVTEELISRQGTLGTARPVDGDVSDEAVQLRRGIGMLLLA